MWHVQNFITQPDGKGRWVTATPPLPSYELAHQLVENREKANPDGQFRAVFKCEEPRS